jgi:hypothetical protein
LSLVVVVVLDWTREPTARIQFWQLLEPLLVVALAGIIRMLQVTAVALVVAVALNRAPLVLELLGRETTVALLVGLVSVTVAVVVGLPL